MLKWQTERAPLPASVVAGAEAILGLRLPESYKALAQAYPGGRPVPDEFVVRHSRGSWRSCVGVLLSLDPRHTDNVFECIKHLAVDNQLPAGLLPVIDDGGGDLVCLDYRQTNEAPTVVYWAHELDGDDAIAPVSWSFEAFLELLDSDSAQTEDEE